MIPSRRKIARRLGNHHSTFPRTPVRPGPLQLVAQILQNPREGQQRLDAGVPALRLERAGQGVAGQGLVRGNFDPSRGLHHFERCCQDNRWLGSETTGRLARWLKSRTVATAFRQ